MLIYQINPNKPPMNPIFKLIILLAVYTLGYFVGGRNKENEIKETLSKNYYNETIRNEAPEDAFNNYYISNNDYDTSGDGTQNTDGNYYINDNRDDASDSKTIKIAAKFDISYYDLSETAKEFYNKIISTATREDNTFITDRELSFTFNKKISEQENINVQAVLYNNYPEIKFYTIKYPNSWIYYETQYINGIPINRIYHFSVRYR